MNAKILRACGLSLVAVLVMSACGNKSAQKPVEAAPTPAVAGAPAQLTGQVSVYNWAEYIPETFVADFKKETGLKVNYDTFDTDETLNAKVITGNMGYDIVVPGAAWAEGQIKQGKYLIAITHLIMDT